MDAEGLHIVPTLTTESTDITTDQLVNGFNVNMTTDADKWGKCTSDEDSTTDDRHPIDVRYPCAAVSNSTKGQIINPVRSARLNTKGKKSIRYGRVEVTARMPKGDWLWPAIWMMPRDSVYGDWPKSGEIDIAESRGNDARTYSMGDNIVSSALHWGTASLNDRWRMTYGEWGGSRARYTQEFHTYGLEWSEKYLFTWLDGRLRVSNSFPAPSLPNLFGPHDAMRSASQPQLWTTAFTRPVTNPWLRFVFNPDGRPGANSPLCAGSLCALFHGDNRAAQISLMSIAFQQVLFFDFPKHKNLWTYGEFAGESVNGSVPVDPWSTTGQPNSPFDQDFYLILNVAVGSTNGWFP